MTAIDESFPHSMPLEADEGFAFGQSVPPLTVYLHGLVRDYPKGIGIIKEFIQNADDAGASTVKIWLDLRSHPADHLPKACMKTLMGPALLIYNDAEFSDDDLDGIQNVGQSVKIGAGSKTGRFGLGFNAAYNITDYPSFLTRDRVRFFDPHKSVVVDRDSLVPGRGWELNSANWARYGDMLRPFELAGLQEGASLYPATVFRLPLRTDEHAANSKICKEVFTKGDFRRIVAQLARTGAELLLFLKHVTSLSVYEVGEKTGSTRCLLEITTENDEEVRYHQEKINHFVTMPTDQVLALLTEANRFESYRHVINVSSQGRSQRHIWRVVSGLYTDQAGDLAASMQEMLDLGEKALPWAGAAARLEFWKGAASQNPKIEGAAYCFLPLSEMTGLPVHVNGYFDLNASRHGITSASRDVIGKDEKRVRWNELVVRHCVAKAYADLLVGLVEDVGEADASHFFKYWPDTSREPSGALAKLRVYVYEHLREERVIPVSGSERWKSIRQVPFIEDRWLSVYPPLVADGQTIGDPAVPEHVRTGFEAAGVTVETLKPAQVRGWLRTSSDVNCRLDSAKRQCLGNRQWIMDLLRFCLRDGGNEDIKGLPLALLASGTLHTFGYTPAQTAFIAGPEERLLFPGREHWFLAPDFVEKTGLKPNAGAKVIRMTPEDVVLNLGTFHKEWPDGKEWNPKGDTPPNAAWLRRMYRYLSTNKSWHPQYAGKLKEFTLVPDQFGRMWKMGTPSTPLLVESSTDQALIKSLKRLGIPLVSGKSELISVVAEFERTFPNTFICKATVRDLVDTLEAFAQHWSGDFPAYQKTIHDPLLDFLSSSQSIQDLHRYPDRIEKLKGLRLLPAETEEMMTARDHLVFVPADYQSSKLATNARLLKTGLHDRWRPLFDLLDIAKLDRCHLIQDLILPNYAHWQDAGKLGALTWLRENLFVEVRRLEARTPLAARALQDSIADAPLVRCIGGQYYPIRKIYDPKADVVRDVLGTTAPIPDMEHYKSGRDVWLSFFRNLGMVDTPRPDDILKHIDGLIEEAGSRGVADVTGRLNRVYNHIRDRWNQLAASEVPSKQPGTASSTLAMSLRGRTWLPAEHNPAVLRQYPGNRMPEDRLYRPAELYMQSQAHLCASQEPICGVADPPASVQRALGFPSLPPVETVCSHLEKLLELWGMADNSGIAVNPLERSLHQIYAYLGRLKGEPDDTEQGAILWDLFDRSEVTSRFAEQACLWDSRSRIFWKPAHVFRSSVPFFEPRRVCINLGDRPQDRGYEVLGRREAPAAEDYVAFLKELSEEFDTGSLPQEIADQALNVLQRLADEFDPEMLDSNLPVLTQSNQLLPACDVYVPDAPWYEPALSEGGIELLHADLVGTELIREIGVLSLRSCVEEHLLQSPESSSKVDLREQCRNWEDRIGSPEFRAGICRLIYSQHESVRAGDLNWLKDVRVAPVCLLRLALQLHRNSHVQYLGKTEVYSHFDPTKNTVYLSESDPGLMENFLAEAINRQLADQQLSDKAPLMTILRVVPAEIDSILTKLRIPPLPRSVMTEDWLTSEEPSSVTDDWLDRLDEPVMDAETQNEQQSGGAELRDQARLQNGRKEAESYDGASHLGSPGPSRPEKPESGLDGDAERLTPDGLSEGTIEQTPDQASEPSVGPAMHRDRRPEMGGADEDLNLSPPTAPGHGRSEGPRTERRAPKGRLLSYVLSDTHLRDDQDKDNDELPENMSIGEAAVQRVLEYEVKAERNPTCMPHNNPGYDVESRSDVGEVLRYIEVKGTEGEWAEAGVPLTPTQYQYGADKGPQFWLYVVEFARDPSRAKLWAIQDPVRSITQFRFDLGWSKLAETNSGMHRIPAVGMRIRLADGIQGTIAGVEGTGVIKRIAIGSTDGRQVSVVFRPDEMTLLPDEG